MVTGLKYNVETGDRFYMPRGTIYASMTHQGATYFWCSKKAATAAPAVEWPSTFNHAPQEAQGETPW